MAGSMKQDWFGWIIVAHHQKQIRELGRNKQLVEKFRKRFKIIWDAQLGYPRRTCRWVSQKNN